nr:hypothetical protein [Leptolyngbya sp. Prado105]
SHVPPARERRATGGNCAKAHSEEASAHLSGVISLARRLRAGGWDNEGRRLSGVLSVNQDVTV